MTVNRFLAAAAILTAATLLLHLFGGGPQYPDFIRQSTLPIGQQSMYNVLWHAVSVNLALAAVAYALASFQNDWRAAAIFVNVEFVGFGALFLWFGLSDLGTLWLMPQWVIFLTVASLALYGMRKKPDRNENGA